MCRVHVHYDSKRMRKGAERGEKGMLTLSYWCFQPGTAMEQLARLKVLLAPALPWLHPGTHSINSAGQTAVHASSHTSTAVLSAMLWFDQM